MSITVMSWAWSHSKADGADLLVLLAIADMAHDNGGGAYPSVKTLSEKARVSERTVQRCVRHLVEIGELSVKAGAARSGANLYRVIMTTPDSESPRQVVTPVMETPSDSHPVRRTGVTTEVPRGDTGVTGGVSPVSPEPSLNHQEPSVKPSVVANAPTKTTDRGHRLPEGWTVPEELFRWSKALGLTEEAIRIEQDKFVDYWRAQPGVKGRKLDWNGTWRNWIRNNLPSRSNRRPDDVWLDAHQRDLARNG